MRWGLTAAAAFPLPDFFVFDFALFLAAIAMVLAGWLIGELKILVRCRRYQTRLQYAGNSGPNSPTLEAMLPPRRRGRRILRANRVYSPRKIRYRCGRATSMHAALHLRIQF
jgi:hypothetical protein